MAINKHRLKKWFNMLTGKSLLHVHQDIGKIFSVSEIKGYYNNLTEKVLKDKQNIEKMDYIPQFQTEKGEIVLFPITIFQYGLGCYDLYLITKNNLYLDKFFTCVQWAMENQEENGAFNCMFFVYPDAPYSAMCQGEAVSLLLRAYIVLGEQKYYKAAQRALDFMLLPLAEGGTTKFENDDVILMEYTHLPAVMNGWIFALFGLFDWTLVCKEEKYKIIFEKCVQTLAESLKDFGCGYWTKYDEDKKIASPFYHNLHIAQMEALKQITGKSIFEEYEITWKKYQKSPWKKFRAFFKKAVQKLLE